MVQADPQPNVPFDPEKLLADRTSKHATASHLACLMSASTVAATSTCDRVEFANLDVPTEVTREFRAGQAAEEDRPLTMSPLAPPATASS